MKRFIYDVLLMMIIVLIGISINDTNVYVDKQSELQRFEEKIEKDEIVSEEGKVVMNQINDNGASVVAKKVSLFFEEVFRFGIMFFYSFFESVLNA